METLDIVVTTQCCNKEVVVTVPREGYKHWQEDGAFIQHALPTLTADQRELLISATCGPCWDKLFPPEPEL